MFNLLKDKVKAAIDSVAKKVGAEEKPRKAAPKKPAPKRKKPEARPEKKEVTKRKPAKKKEGILEAITKVVTEKKLSEKMLDDALWELQLALLENNVASDVAEGITGNIKKALVGRSVKRSEARKIIHQEFRKSVRQVLDQKGIDIVKLVRAKRKKGEPTLIIALGFNGSGKTTSLAKLGRFLQKKKFSVIFAAGDTFRAAAIHQLGVHAERLGIRMIRHDYGADSAAVIFDAVKHAKAKKIDAVLADTAGRSHADRNLLEELRKVVRVNRPDASLLVIEALAGNDVVEQARVFNEVGVDGIIMTKWDVDEKGGAALSATHAIGKPILFLGTGQEYKDFEEFDVKKAVKSIL